MLFHQAKTQAKWKKSQASVFAMKVRIERLTGLFRWSLGGCYFLRYTC